MAEQLDILRPLAVEEFQELIKIYNEKYGKQNFHYLLMYNQNKWNEQIKNLNCEANEDGADEFVSFRKTFYTYRNGDFRKYGTYVSLHYDLPSDVHIRHNIFQFILFYRRTFILQVLPTEQRKGFGSLMAARLCKEVALVEKVDLTAWIVNENFKSKSLLEKIGFRTIAKSEWIQLNKA
ncbi:uncharacterized protein [Eurosta solidaginis]|uniref:uncharacterized protein n=1 Tax=Eurosta solidaginis TaxID=178769 RepID=UPI0035308AFF